MSSKSQPEVTIRVATPEDSSICGQICYDAFLNINTAHGFPCDFPGPEATTRLLSMMFSSPGFYCVVAEDRRARRGKQLPVRAFYRSAVSARLPSTPSTQHLGIGRKLMQAVIDRAKGRNAGLRLVQAAFHNRSLALYTSLGFDVREPLSCVQGRTRERGVSGCVVRPAQSSDLDACNALSQRVHGYDRGAELAQARQQKTALVVERGGRVTGYASALAFFGHATAETNLDMQALIASAESFGGSGILVPSRNSALLRWCLGNGLRIVQPMTLMSTGLYNEPAGAWLPSILF